MVDALKRLRLVGEFIRSRREVKGLSQRALGLLFVPPVTTQFISNVERGVTPLPPVHVPTLAQALGVSDAELMALLEKEYALKLSGRLGKEDSHSTKAELGSINGALVVERGDFDFMRGLYEAYRSADPKTRLTFSAMCENVLRLPKVNIP